MYRKISGVIAAALLATTSYQAQSTERVPKGLPEVGQAVVDSFYPTLIMRFKLTNPERYPVKDVPVSCQFIAPSGTVVADRVEVAYVIVPAHGEVWTNAMNFGFAPNGLDRWTNPVDCLTAPAPWAD